MSDIEGAEEDTSDVPNIDGVMSSDSVYIRENSVDEPMQSDIECESTHTGNETISIQAASLDIEMVLEPTHMDHQAKKNEQPTSSMSENSPDTAAGSDEVGETGTGNQRKVMKDRDWVKFIAGILRQNGKGMEWNEIVDTWVKLQRHWDNTEVRRGYHFF